MAVSTLTTYGGHRFRVGDATGAAAELLGGQRARVFYTDPPWGPGKMKYFEGLVERATGVRPPPRDYRDLARDVLAQGAQFTDGPVYLLYGEQWRGEIVEIGQSVGLTSVAVVPVRYTIARTMDQHIFLPPHPKLDVGIVYTPAFQQGLQARYGVPRVTFSLQPWFAQGGIVMDLTCGYGGLLQQAAQRLGMRFYGNELNATRLERAQRVAVGVETVEDTNRA